MKTIQKIRVADCDRSYDDRGKPTSAAYQYCVCEDFDIAKDYETFDTQSEAEAYIQKGVEIEIAENENVQ